jgi:hypothetical protein
VTPLAMSCQLQVKMANDDRTVHLIPLKPYKEQEVYSIYITPEVHSPGAGSTG